jgi:transcriptional regulator with XRE-family HTH domain
MPRKKRAPESIGDTIKRVMKERGLTAYAVSKKSGVHETQISRWLKNERVPSLGTAEKIAAALDLVLVPRERERAE